MKKPFLILFAFLLVGTISKAQDSISFEKLTLKDAQTYAINHNANVKNAATDIKIAKYKKWETTAMGLPQASIAVSYQHIFDVPVMELQGITYIPNPAEPNNPFSHAHGLSSTKLELGSANSTNIDFNINQLLFSGEYIVGLQAAKVYMSLSQKGLKKQEHEIKETVAKTFQLILVAEESVKVLDSISLSLTKLLGETKQMQQAGFVQSTDVQQLQLNLKTTENSIISFKRQKEVLYRLLKYQTGIDVKQEITLDADLSQIIGAAEEDAYAAGTFNPSSTPSMQLLEVQEKLSELTLRREQTTYLPSVVAFYRHQEQLNAPAFNASPADIFGVKIDIPIFSSGKRYTRVQQKKLDYLKIQTSKQQAEQGMYLDFMQSQSDFAAAQLSFENQKKSKELAKKIYEDTLIKYKTGTESSLVLTQVQSQYFRTLSAYYSSLNELLSKQTKLKSLLNLY